MQNPEGEKEENICVLKKNANAEPDSQDPKHGIT
jgi:hypothetical protein